MSADENPVEPTEAAAPRTEEEQAGGMGAGVKVAIVFALLAGVVALLLGGNYIFDDDTGAGSAFVYSKLVDEVMASPEEFRGREVRVEGELRQGSILFREEPCEWRFVIEKNGHEMPVRFPQCVVPDTFRDGFGISVTVQGELQADDTFLANQVVPRCPSKYEMEQRLESGEEMPHADPAAVPDPS